MKRDIFQLLALDALVLISLVFGASGLQAKQSQALDHVIAIVNDDVITQSELERHGTLLLTQLQNSQELPSKDILQKQILNKMIIDKVQLQLAESGGIDIDEMSVDTAIKQLADEKKLSLQQFRDELTAQGIVFEDFRDYVKMELALSRLREHFISRDVVITKTDVESYLNSPVGQDQSGTEYQLGHILILPPDAPTPEIIKKTQEKAVSISDSLKMGADFHQVAIKTSVGQRALQGGNMGWRSISEIPTLFAKYVPTMTIGETYGPIRSASGFHIIKLLDKRIGEQKLHVETHVRHILIKPSVNTSDDEARKSLEKIRHSIVETGGEFATKAEKYSEELHTASSGGDLGWITKDKVLPAFYGVVQSLPVGRISEPFQTELGWHLIEVLGRRNQSNSGEAARNRARLILHQRKYHELLEVWLKRIHDQAQIEIFL